MYHRSFPPLPEASPAFAPHRPPAAAPRRVLLAADLQHRLTVLQARRAVSAGASAVGTRGPAAGRADAAAPTLPQVAPPDAPMSGITAPEAIRPDPAATPGEPWPAAAGPRRVMEPPPARGSSATIAGLPPTSLRVAAVADTPLVLTGAQRTAPRPWEEALTGDTFDFDFAGLYRR